MSTPYQAGTILIVPGLRDFVADHWQTHLEAAWPGARSVAPLTKDKFSCAARVAALDAVLAAIDGPVILVAHSAGVITLAHWARNARREIRAALLVTPPDLSVALPGSYPQPDVLRAEGWLPVPHEPLPFPSVMMVSTNDPLCSYERALQMAGDWCCEVNNLGQVGHMNPASGFGPWPMAARYVELLDREYKAELV
ncbi:MAG: alpha/beta hydrolase [Pseudomonadota bacterium]